MRRRYVASKSLRRHVPARNLAPLGPPISKPWPPNILDLPTPMKYIRWKKKLGVGVGFAMRDTRDENSTSYPELSTVVEATYPQNIWLSHVCI